jgi:uncharacterized protein (DUF4415 family)
MRKLTSEQKRDIAAIRAKSDEDIDFSDMPQVADWSRAEIGKFYRPAKKPVTIRLDEDILDWLKGHGSGYQTKVNLLLRHSHGDFRWLLNPSEGRPPQPSRNSIGCPNVPAVIRNFLLSLGTKTRVHVAPRFRRFAPPTCRVAGGTRCRRLT